MSSISGIFRKPLMVAIIAGLVCLSLGLIWGWVIQPVEWLNASPDLLHPVYQEEYLRMAIDSFAENGNENLAFQRWQVLGPAAPNILATIVANQGSQDSDAIRAYEDLIRTMSGGTIQPPVTTPTAESLGSWSYIIIIVAVIVVSTVGFTAYRYLRPIRRRGEATPAQQAREYSRQAELTDYAVRGEEPPIAQFVTTYVLGDDLFDDSFSIDSPAGEFLGECGVGISETIGVGDPKKVSAFEVWLFDKNDIQTVTKILMSSHAFNDLATVQRLEAKGEPVLLERGRQTVLETAALLLIATVSDIEHGQGALPAGSFFERLTLELAIWQKTPEMQ